MLASIQSARASGMAAAPIPDRMSASRKLCRQGHQRTAAKNLGQRALDVGVLQSSVGPSLCFWGALLESSGSFAVVCPRDQRAAL